MVNAGGDADNEDSVADVAPAVGPARVRSQAPPPPPGVDAADRSWSGSESAIPFAIDDDQNEREAARSDPAAGQKPSRSRDNWKPDRAPSPRPIPRGARLD